MTMKEIELRIANLEKSVAVLARKQNDRDNRNDEKITETSVLLEDKDTALETSQAEISEQVLTQGAVIDELLTDILPSLMGE